MGEGSPRTHADLDREEEPSPQGDARQHHKSHLPIFVLAALQGSRVHIHLKGGLEGRWGRCVWHHILNDHGQWKCQSPCRRAFPGSGGRSGSAQGPPDPASLLAAASAVWLASRKPAKLARVSQGFNRLHRGAQLLALLLKLQQENVSPELAASWTKGGGCCTPADGLATWPWSRGCRSPPRPNPV